MSKKQEKYLKKSIKIVISIFVFLTVLKLFFFNEKTQSYIRNDIYNYNNIKRAVIVDRSNDMLVSNINSYSLYVYPNFIPDYSQWIKSVSSALNIDENELYNKLLNSKTITVIYDDLTYNQANNIKKLGIKGIEVIEREKREYLYKNLASDIIGFLDKDNKGIAGLEFFYDNQIRYQTFDGIDEKREFKLTIEKNLQLKAESELERLISGKNSKGSLIIMASHTGEIISMANYPRLDRENFSHNYKNLYNYAITENFRAIPIVILTNFLSYATNHNLSDINQLSLTERNYTNLINETFSFYSPFNGDLLKEISESSIFSSILVHLGFGQKTGVDLPNESPGIIGNIFDNSSSLNAFEVYGTPLQILRAYNALINDGKLVTPFIAYSEFSPKKIQTIENDRIDLKKHGNLIRKLVKANGGYPLVSIDQGSNPSSEANNQIILIGHHPLDNPKVSYIVALSGVNHNNILKNEGMRRFIEIAENASKITFISQDENQFSPTQAYLSQDKPTEPINTMPDLRGYPLRKAISMLQGSCNLTVKGSGAVYSQSPDPGSTINDKTNCTIKLR